MKIVVNPNRGHTRGVNEALYWTYHYLKLLTGADIVLEADRANRREFSRAVMRPAEKLIVGSGHGQTDRYTGQDLQLLLSIDDKLADYLENSKIALLSCWTAKELGKWMNTAKHAEYLGFDSEFVFAVHPDRDPLDRSNYAYAFLEPIREAFQMLLNTGNMAECFLHIARRYAEIIPTLPEDIAAMMRHDLTHLKYYGKELVELKIRTVANGKPVYSMVRIDEDLYEGEEIKVRLPYGIYRVTATHEDMLAEQIVILDRDMEVELELKRIPILMLIWGAPVGTAGSELEYMIDVNMDTVGTIHIYDWGREIATVPIKGHKAFVKLRLDRGIHMLRACLGSASATFTTVIL